VIPGLYAPQLILKYDLYLSNFSTATVENLAVEVWDGSAWNQVQNTSNSGGSIPWTTKTVDISQFSDTDIQIRFDAWGSDSYNINYWYLDNIYVISTSGGGGYNPCVIGYNFYLNTVLTGFTVDTTFLIPPNLVQYGMTYDACVNAVYGSGYSTEDCYTFTSHFLYPPINLQVEGVECAAYLTWEKPAMVADNPILAVQPRTELPGPSVDYSPMEVIRENNYTDAMWDVLFSWNGTDAARPGIEADMDNVYLTAWQSGFGAPPWFQKYEKMTGVFVEGFDIAGATALRDMATDGQYYYASPASTTLYQMDFASQTLVSSFGTGASSGIRHIAYDPNLDNNNGGFWCGNWYDMKAIAMDGTLLWSGPALDACYGSAFDNQTPGGPFLWTFEQAGAATQDIYQWTISYNPMGLTQTGVMFNVGTVPGTSGGLAGGLCADPVGTKWALIADVQVDPQFVVGLELADYSGPGGDPPGLIGYNVYRDGAFLAYVSGKDTTWYYDFDVNPGTHMYAVSAWYDLTDYGFPGQFDESLLEGPVEHQVLCGRDLPFCEPWDQASFAYNEWTFSPDQGNWSVTTAQGNPEPTADFGWNPIMVDYSYGLESPILNAGPWNCASLWLDYDLKLDDRNATGNEKLLVEIYYNGMWQPVAEYENNGSFGWESYSHDISNAVGMAIKVRFTAHGQSTEDILHWYVDNICVYGVCNPPSELDAEVLTGGDGDVLLTWMPPECVGGGGGPSGQLIELIQHDGNPLNGYYQSFDYVYGVVWDLGAYPDATLEALDFRHSSWGTYGTWDYKLHVVDYDTYTLISEIGPLQTTGDDKWEENISLGQIMGYGGGNVGVFLEPMGNSPTDAYPCLDADNMGPDGVSLYGPLPNYSALTTSGIGDFLMDLWIRSNFDDGLVNPGQITAQYVQSPSHVPGVSNVPATLTMNQTVNRLPQTDFTEQEVLGYNVFRMLPTGTNYVQLTPTPIVDTFYVDQSLSFPQDEGEISYYVTALFEDAECESDPSNIANVDWPAVGINELGAGDIRIFPNPVTDIVNIQSSYTILDIEVMSFIGQSVYTQRGVDSKATKLNVSNLQAGVYLVKVTTDQGVRAAKIMVTR